MGRVNEVRDKIVKMELSFNKKILNRICDNLLIITGMPVLNKMNKLLSKATIL